MSKTKPKNFRIDKITRTSSGKEYSTDAILNHQDNHPRETKESIRPRAILGNDKNKKYLRDENSDMDEFFSKTELNEIKRKGRDINNDNNFHHLKQIANNNNPNTSNYTKENMSDIAKLANKMPTKTLSKKNIKDHQNEQYRVTICNAAGACAIIAASGFAIGKAFGILGGKKTRKSKNTRKNKK
jgi:hypothetical protein